MWEDDRCDSTRDDRQKSFVNVFIQVMSVRNRTAQGADPGHTGSAQGGVGPCSSLPTLKEQSPDGEKNFHSATVLTDNEVKLSSSMSAMQTNNSTLELLHDHGISPGGMCGRLVRHCGSSSSNLSM